MLQLFRRATLIIAIMALSVCGLSTPSQASTQFTDFAPTHTETPGPDQGLTAEQIAAIEALETAAPVSVEGVAKPQKGDVSAAATRRASYYQGSWLMWSRDNVDFGFNWSQVTWSSGYQDAGWVFPNLARNDGISRYHVGQRSHKWRAGNSFGAGTPTPWGDVKVYNLSYTTDMAVKRDGAWWAVRS